MVVPFEVTDSDSEVNNNRSHLQKSIMINPYRVSRLTKQKKCLKISITVFVLLFLIFLVTGVLMIVYLEENQKWLSISLFVPSLIFFIIFISLAIKKQKVNEDITKLSRSKNDVALIAINRNRSGRANSTESSSSTDYSLDELPVLKYGVAVSTASTKKNNRNNINNNLNNTVNQNFVYPKQISQPHETIYMPKAPVIISGNEYTYSINTPLSINSSICEPPCYVSTYNDDSSN